MTVEDGIAVEHNLIRSDVAYFTEDWSLEEFLEFLFTDEWVAVNHVDVSDGNCLLRSLLKSEMYEYAVIVRDVLHHNMSRQDAFSTFL